MERMSDLDEEAEVRRRHLQWCLSTSAQLEDGGPTDLRFDEAADDLRAGLGWVTGQRQLRAEAHRLAVRLARLSFVRGLSDEAQRRFEEAAKVAADDAEAAEALHKAATVAWSRLAGNEATRLYRAAAEAAGRGGDPRRAAIELATAAELVNRAPGTMSSLPAPGEQQALLAEARALAFGDAGVEATVLTVVARGDDLDPVSAELAERAVELARRVGDARLESAALDQLTSTQLGRGEVDDAAVSIERRLELLAGRAHDVEMAWEYSDVLHMAPMVYLGAGNFEAARRYAHERDELVFFRDAAHLSAPWLLVTAALAGDFDEAIEVAERIRLAWHEAGRPTLGGLGVAPAAAAMVHGIRGDDRARQEWLDIRTEMLRVVAPLVGFRADAQLFDAMVALHRGEADGALTRLSEAPESLRRWYDGVWRQWYAAVWAEAAVLAEQSDRHQRLARARPIVGRNPVAKAMVDRAAALVDDDHEGLLAAAAEFDAAGCAYQRARTLVLAGGEARREGEDMMTAIGAAPMTL
jgi:tetratricopeptide (TPR) repeat protein